MNPEIFAAAWTAAVCVLYCRTGVQDWKTRIVPNQYPLLLFLLGLIQWSGSRETVFLKIAGLVFPVAATLFFDCIFRVRSGGADIKMYAATGFVFGLSGLVCIWAATFIIALAWLLIRKIPFQTKLPMCSFLAIGGCGYAILLLMMK